MQLVERFKLHRQVWPASNKHTLENAERYWNENRNFEFFYIPFSDTSLLLTHNVTTAPSTPPNDDTSTSGMMQLKSLRDSLKWFTPLRRWLLKRAVTNEPTENVIGESWDLLASERNVRFNEMEYHLPVERGLEALEEVRHYIETKRPDVFFPFEARQTKGMMLGYHRSTAAIGFRWPFIAITRMPSTSFHRCRADFPEIRWQASLGQTQQHDSSASDAWYPDFEKLPRCAAS